ncbi:inner nuclear membrane protein enriched at telomere/subtelomere region [Cladophialophora chaetospira]|uniref:Inner nuclear membrane protein enriched at telomere/subtelomere region n=1 Tax=Cladophialophora chaetospira TaxID=386627 RepID=A0AA38X7J6_9EURO|nr:inner nuclear membrane protein enriched at telomere/subtelomere region [Cladophialophora chaetospira]
MADEDELYYLQPGFDLNSLTVPRIRSILVAQNINYPSSAKKGQLLEIIETELLPKRDKLLRAQARVRRTSKGITDVPSSQESTLSGDEDDDRQLMPPPPAPKTPRSRKSKSELAAAEPVPRTPSTAKRTKTPSRRSTTRTPRASDTEHTEPEEVKSTVRRPRKSAPAQPPLEPAVKIEEPDARLKRHSREAGTSPFSDENPFQSGSSPPSASDRRKSASRSRKSLASSTTKRKSTTPNIKQEDSPTSRSSVTFPVSRVTSLPAEDGIATTEEFTPDAAQEPAEAEQNGQLVPGRTSALVRRKKKKSAGPIAKTAPLAVLTTVLAALGAWYRQEKINVGYCGVGEPNWSLTSNTNIPAWVHENLQPSCEPCPQHAVCYPNMEVECENDFVLKPHPLSLNGGIPLPPTCEPDSEKQRRIKSVADRAIEELRQRRASYECGEQITTPTNAATGEAETDKAMTKPTQSKLEVSEEELKQTISKLRRKHMSNEEFEDLFRSALGDIMDRDEVEVTQDRYVSDPIPTCTLVRDSVLPTSLVRVDDTIAPFPQAPLGFHVDLFSYLPVFIFGVLLSARALDWIYQHFV